MSLAIRRDAEIYDTEGGWFRARWHFSFDRYLDPENDSFGAMRVFNDDRLIPGAVWPLHPHRDVEGADVRGRGHVRPRGQRRRAVRAAAGRVGPAHDPWLGCAPFRVERLEGRADALHPDLDPARHRGLPPGVEQRIFTTEDRTNRLLRVIGPEGGDVVLIHQDASVHVARLEPGHRSEPSDRRGAWRLRLPHRWRGRRSTARRRARATRPRSPTSPRSRIRADATSELILVDVPMRFEPVGIWAGRT